MSESVEEQLIRSLVKKMVLNDNSHISKYYKALNRIKNRQNVINILLDSISRCQDSKVKENLLDLYMKYFIDHATDITALPQPFLFENFKQLSTNFESVSSFNKYNDLSTVLEMIITNIKSFKPQTLYSTIVNWSSKIMNLSLYSMSKIYTDFKENCFSNIIITLERNGQSLPTIAAMIFFMKSNELTKLSHDFQVFLEQKDFDNTSTNLITTYLLSKSIDDIKIGILLLGSMFHFLPEDQSLSLCLNFVDQLITISNEYYKIVLVMIADAISNLPVNDESPVFNTFQQLYRFVPIFGKRIIDFSSDLANAFMNYVEPRSKNPQFLAWVLNLYEYDEQINGTTLMSCRFGLYQSSTDIFNHIFPSVDKLTKSQKEATCLATIYLSKNNLITKDIMLAALPIVVEALDPQAFQSLADSSIKYPAIFIDSFLKLLTKLTDDKATLIPFISAIIRLFHSTEEFDLIKSSSETFAKDMFMFLKMYIETSDDDDGLSHLILYLLSVISASGHGSKLEKTEELKRLCLQDLINKLIPEEYKQSVYDLSIESATQSASIISISLKDTNPMSIMKSIEQCESPILFIRFFAVASKQNPYQTIDYLNRITEERQVESYSLFKKTFSLFYAPNEVQEPKIPYDVTLRTIQQIIESNVSLNADCLSLLFTIFEKIDLDDEVARTVFSILSKQRQKCQLNESFILKILASDKFLKSFPDFLYVIHPTENHIMCLLKTWIKFEIIDLNHDLCEAIKENYSLEVFFTISTYVSSISYKHLHFVKSLCSSFPGQIDIDLAISLIRLIASEDYNERILAQESLNMMFNITSHDESFNVDSTISYGQVVTNISNYSDALVSNIPIEKMQTMFLGLTDKNISEVLFASSAIQKYEWKLIDSKIEIFTLLVNLGNKEHVSFQNAVRLALLSLVESDLQRFLKSISTFTINSFIKSVLIQCLDQNPEAFETFVVNSIMSLRFNTEKDTISIPFQSLHILCKSNKNKNLDPLLLWLLLVSYSILVHDYPKIAILSSKFVQNMLNKSAFAVFNRLSLQYQGIDDVDLVSYETTAKKYFQHLMKLNYNNLSNLIEMLDNISVKRNTLTTIVVSICIILALLLQSMIKFSNAKLTDLISEKLVKIAGSGKDESCRLICAYLAPLFSANDLSKLSSKALDELMNISLRSLIQLNENTMSADFIFFLTLFIVLPSGSVIEEDARLFDALTKSFDNKDLIGLPICLDALLAYVKVSPHLEKFNNMSSLSLPRLLSFTLNQDQEIRIKAEEILQILVENTDIVVGLSQKLDEDAFCILALFIADWAGKNSPNKFTMNLLLNFAVRLKDNKEASIKYTKKVTPVLMPIANNDEHKYQHEAIDIMAILIELAS